METPTILTTAEPATVGTDGSISPIAVLKRTVENAKKLASGDAELISIVEKHVLKVDPKDNAVQAAASEIEKLAAARAAKTT